MPLLLPRKGSKNDIPTGPPLMVVWVIGLLIITIALTYYLFRGCFREVVSLWLRVRFTRRLRNATQSGMAVISFSPPSDTSKPKPSRARRPVLHELQLIDGNVATGKKEWPLGCSSRPQIPGEQTPRPLHQQNSSRSTCYNPFRHKSKVQPHVIAKELGLELPVEVAEAVWPITMPGKDEKVAFGVVNYSIVEKG